MYQLLLFEADSEVPLRWMPVTRAGDLVAEATQLLAAEGCARVEVRLHGQRLFVVERGKAPA